MVISNVEIFSLVKFQAISGHGMDLMTEADVADDYKEIRENLAKVSLSYYFCEVISKITHEGEVNIELYNLILKSLDGLKKGIGLKELRFDFVRNLLIMMGYWPKGHDIPNPDEVLEEVVERQIYSKRVGKIMLK